MKSGCICVFVLRVKRHMLNEAGFLVSSVTTNPCCFLRFESQEIIPLLDVLLVLGFTFFFV